MSKRCVSQATHQLCVFLATCVLAPAVLSAGWSERGVVVGLYASDPRFDYGTTLDEVRDLGATSVLFLVRFHQHDVGSPRPSPMTPHDRETLARVLRLATTRGLRSAVIPILALDELAKGKWRGTIAPES